MNLRRQLPHWLALVAVLGATTNSFAAEKGKGSMHITLTSKRIERHGDGWRCEVTVVFTNDGKKEFALDKLTAALDGGLNNNVFVVTGPGGAELSYRGEMAKRAPPGPSGFARIAPGKSVETTIDLGAFYALPKSGGRLTVKFNSANHFSVDDVQLESTPIELVLK